MDDLRPARRRTRAAATSGERGLACAAIFVALALVAALMTALSTGTTHVVAAGDRIPLQGAVHNGQVHEVVVPGATVSLQVGRPVKEVGPSLVELSDVVVDEQRRWSGDPVRAASGTRLVPVTWSVRASTPGSTTGTDSVPIVVRLVAGERSVDLADGTFDQLRVADEQTLLPSSLIAIDEGAALSVEVEFDGATQTLDVATGELDTGVAQGLYSPAADLDLGCDDYTAWCRLDPADPDAPWRPGRSDATVTTGPLALHSYDAELGWADEGTRWATTTVRTSSVSGVEDRDGGYRPVTGSGRPTVLLDEARPRRTSGLDRVGDVDARFGAVVFAVDADSTPRELTIEQDLTLDGQSSPRTLPLRATIAIDEG